MWMYSAGNARCRGKSHVRASDRYWEGWPGGGKSERDAKSEDAEHNPISPVVSILGVVKGSMQIFVRFSPLATRAFSRSESKYRSNPRTRFVQLQSAICPRFSSDNRLNKSGSLISRRMDALTASMVRLSKMNWRCSDPNASGTIPTFVDITGTPHAIASNTGFGVPSISETHT